MKKLFILLLMISSTLLLISCDDSNQNNNNTTNEDNESTNENTNQNNDSTDYFAELTKAISFSMNYDGDFTTKKVIEECEFEYDDDEEYTDTYTEIVSYDKDNKIGYYQDIDDEQTRTLKIFNQNNTFYCLKQIKENGLSDNTIFTQSNDYYKVYGEYTLVDSYDIKTSNILNRHLRGLHLASSLEEVKNAYDTVLANSAKNTADFATKNDDLDYAKGTVNSNITLTNDNNVITLTIDIVMNLSDYDDYEENYKYTTTVKASDGKVTELIATLEEAYDDGKSIYKITYNFDHNFSQKEYDDIVIPQINVDTIETNKIATIYDGSNNINKTFVTENIVHNDEWVNLYNLDNLGDVLASYLEHEYSYSGVIKGVYKDKEHTKPITNENFTVDDLMKIEKIYLDVEINDGYAAVRSRYTISNKLSKEYQIVLGDHWMYNREQSSSMTTPYLLSENPVYTFYNKDHLTLNEDYYIMVNGSKVSSNQITLENKTEYYVEYVYNMNSSTVCLDTLFEAFVGL